jgi:hypothetical protein
MEQFWTNPTNWIAVFGVIFAAVAAWGPIFVYWKQYRRENMKAVASLHEKWWSPEFKNYREIVWKELEAWQLDKENCDAIQHFKSSQGLWELSDPRRIAHSHVLFFFAEVSALLRRRLLDEDLMFEMLGVHQYAWFQDYFAAIRTAVASRIGGHMPPYYLYELEGFDRKFEKWKAGKGERFLGYQGDMSGVVLKTTNAPRIE